MIVWDDPDLILQGHEGNLEGFSSQNQGNPIKVQTKWEQKFDGGKKWILIMNFTTSKKIFSKNFRSEENKLKREKEPLAAKGFLRMNRGRRQIMSPFALKG